MLQDQEQDQDPHIQDQDQDPWSQFTTAGTCDFADAMLPLFIIYLSFDVCNYRMGPRLNTQRHDAFDSFLFHVIFYVILHFKINIIISNLFSC